MTTANQDTIEEIVRLGEVQMEDALAMALAADQRATGLGSILAAVSAGLFAAIATSGALKTLDMVLLATSCFGFLVAAGCAMRAATPVDYYPRGFQPKHFADREFDLAKLRNWTAEDIQDRILKNRQVLNRTARLTIISQRIAYAAVILPLALKAATAFGL